MYLLWWYYINPANLLELKREVEKQWVTVKIINQRYYSKKSLWKISRELKRQMDKDKWKEIILFWYSAWGVIAHKIWKRDWYKSVSFWLSEEPAKTMVWTLLSLTKEKEIKDLSIPENWVNIIEQFSAMVPNVWQEDENTIRLDDVYSHMTIWKEEVIQEIRKHILLWFQKP